MNESQKFVRWKLWSGVIAVFIVGVIVGGLSTSVLMRSHLLHVMRSGHARPYERIAKELTRDLGLNAGQRAQVDRIVSEFGPRFEEFEQRSRTEVRAIAEDMERQIRDVLTPDQQAKYDRNIERIREEMTRREHREHGGGSAEQGGPR